VERAFLVMAGIGLDAQMAAKTNQELKKRIGWLAYSDPIARSILGNRQFDLTFRLDDEPEVSTRAHTVIVGNSGSLTAGLLLIPAATIDDGMLDAVILRPGRGAGWTNGGGSPASARTRTIWRSAWRARRRAATHRKGSCARWSWR